MRLIKEIRDGQLTRPKVRETTRIVMLDSEGFLPLLFLSKEKFHSLPGGGIEHGETMLDSARRESLEETGCELEISGEIGMIVEHRAKWNLKQVSFGYFGKATKVCQPKFTRKEKREGFVLLWLTIDEAVARLKNDCAKTYEAPFIRERDLAFLEEARKLFKL